MRTLDVWYDRTTAADLLEHFPRRYRAQAQARRHARRCAKTTSAPSPSSRPTPAAAPRVRRGPAHRRAPRVDRPRHGRGRGDGRGLPVVAERRPALPARPVPLVDVARRVVGVGSVGTRCWVCLFEATGDADGPDRIVLQVKEAQPSVLAPYVGASTLGHEGRRVVAGQRLTQAASDIFLGWCEGPRSGATTTCASSGTSRVRATSPAWTWANSPTTARCAPGPWPGPTPAPATPPPSPATWARRRVRPGHRRIRRQVRGEQRSGPRHAGRTRSPPDGCPREVPRRSCCGGSSPM